MELKINTIRPLVESIFGRITEDQWRSLSSGSPCDGTKILLAELILEIISSVTRTLLTTIRGVNMPLAKRKVVSSLDAVLLQSLLEALGIPDQADNVYLKSLSDLIQSEVRQNVDTYFSNTWQTVPPKVYHCIVSPSGLSAIVNLFSKVLKTFGAKIKKSFTLRPPKRPEVKSALEEVEDAAKTEDPFGSCNGCLSCCQSVSSGTTMPSKKALAEDCIKTKACETLQEEINKVLGDIILPFMNDLPEDARNLLQSEAAVELQRLCDGIVTLLERKAKKKRPVKKVRRRIKTFLGKLFAKVLIHCVVEQLRRQHPEHGSTQNSQSVETLVEVTADGEKRDGGKEDSLVLLFNDIPSSERLVFTEELSGMIYCHFFRILSDFIMGRKTWRDLHIPEFHADMYADIQSKVWLLMELMNWWLNSEVSRLSKRVKIPKLDLMPLLVSLKEEAAGMEDAETEDAEKDATEMEDAEMEDVEKESGEVEDVEKETAEKDAAEKDLVEKAAEKSAAEREHAEQIERNKMCVKFFVEKIVQHVYLDLQVVPENTSNIIIRIFEKIWPKVQGQDFYITQNSFKNLNKMIHKLLCKTLGTPEIVLFSLIKNDARIDSIILAILQKQVMTPPIDSSPVRRFFKSLFNRFRLRNKVGAIHNEEKPPRPDGLPPTEHEKKISSCLIPPQQWITELKGEAISSPDALTDSSP